MHLEDELDEAILLILVQLEIVDGVLQFFAAHVPLLGKGVVNNLLEVAIDGPIEVQRKGIEKMVFPRRLYANEWMPARRTLSEIEAAWYLG